MAAIELDGAAFFNCCTGNAAPDWTAFKSLEIGGCIVEIDDKTGDSFVIGGKSHDEAEFWTVYARHHSGEAEAITDCDDLELVYAIGERLAEVSGLPLFTSLASLT